MARNRAILLCPITICFLPYQICEMISLKQLNKETIMGLDIYIGHSLKTI